MSSCCKCWTRRITLTKASTAPAGFTRRPSLCEPIPRRVAVVNHPRLCPESSKAAVTCHATEWAIRQLLTGLNEQRPICRGLRFRCYDDHRVSDCESSCDHFWSVKSRVRRPAHSINGCYCVGLMAPSAVNCIASVSPIPSWSWIRRYSTDTSMLASS